MILMAKMKRIPVDIPMYSYKNHDTTIEFCLSHNSSTVIYQDWIINFNNLDSINLYNYFKEKHCFIFNNPLFNNLEKNFFFVINNRMNTIFRCHINLKHQLEIRYYFPYSIE